MTTNTFVEPTYNHSVGASRSLLPERIPPHSPRLYFIAAIIMVLATIPFISEVLGHSYYTTLFARIMIYGIAATALNLLLGYMGLISLGHALYLGIGVYGVGILQAHGITDGWVQLMVVLAVALVISLVTGVICLRTNGMGFIMITLAFAQMFYFLAVSLESYGGDDGMRLESRSYFGLVDFSNLQHLYWTAFVLLITTMYLCWRLVHSRLGYVVRGIKSNERRVRALGLSPIRYKLLIFTFTACLTAIAGVLLVNLTNYVSPSYMSWQVSGELIVMIIVGGIATIVGPLMGVIALLIFEELLTGSSISLVSEHWMLLLGIFIILVVLNAKKGLYGAVYAKARSMEMSKGEQSV